MISAVNGQSSNGHASSDRIPKGAAEPDIIDRLMELDREYYTNRKSRDAQSTYSAGDSDRMSPVPRGVNPLGTDADYHYCTERNYFLMVERARNSVRNHPLVEQGINRLIANLRLGALALDVNSGDPSVDADRKADWAEWCGDPKQCDYEQRRTFAQICRQSFFNQVTDGDIIHLPLREGSLQTWESHHIRNPWGRQPTGSSVNGMIHGAEVKDGRTVAWWITPRTMLFNQTVQRGESRRFAAFDAEGNKIVYWLGFTHRFLQRRGVSRLSPPRDAMNGFDDLNYANIKSSLRRALISFLMKNTQQPQAMIPGGPKIPQAGGRYVANDQDFGLQSMVVEQVGEPAQVWKTPPGYDLEGWNANMPTAAFFEHSALLLTMLAVNLDLPLMFLLLDGSLVNFHGGRMTFDQVKLRLDQLISDQIQGLYNPTYEWKTRQRLTPGSKQFDPALYNAVKRGRANPFKFLFRAKGHPYVKPLEDAAAEDLAERRNLKSLKSILGARGVDEDEHIEEVVVGRGKFIRRAITEAKAIQQEHSDVVATEEVPRLWREIRYGNEISGVQLAISADTTSGDTTATATSSGKPSSNKTRGGANADN